MRSKDAQAPNTSLQTLSPSGRERLVHQRPDRSQRMVLANPRLQIHVAEQRPPDLSSDPRKSASPKRPKRLNHDSVREASDFFNSLLVALAALGYGNPPFSQAVQEDTKAMRSPRTTD